MGASRTVGHRVDVLRKWGDGLWVNTKMKGDISQI